MRLCLSPGLSQGMFAQDETGRHDPKGVWDLMNSKSQATRESLDPRILALQSLGLVSSANRSVSRPSCQRWSLS
jgi:hypothetical protein